MRYIQTYESFSFSGSINEATEDSLVNLKDRIQKLTELSTRLNAKDYKGLLDKKKSAIDSAKESKDSLRMQIAEREYKVTELKQKKHQLRLEMIKKEIEYQNQKLVYQQQSVAINGEIEKLKPKK